MADKGGTGKDRRRRFEDEAIPHLDALYAMALRLVHNADDAGDLLQETVLRAYRFFDQYETGTNCRAWMLTILFNNFRNGYRRAAREQPASSVEEFERRVEAESFQGDQGKANPELIAAGAGLGPEVSDALEELAGEFRETLLLIDVEELSYQEAAQVLGVPVGTVKSRVSRGRAILREKLKVLAKERGILRS